MGQIAKEKIDDDIWALNLSLTETVLLQILRELRREGPEEKTSAVKGFSVGG